MPAGKRNKIKRLRNAPDRDPKLTDFDPEFLNYRDDCKRLRERFAREYIKDFNASATMRRLGYRHKAVHVHGAKMLAHPYTQYVLGRLMDQLDEKAIVTRNMVMLGLLKEANAHGFEDSHAARISAWRALAKILGMEITKVEGSMTLEGGVMAVPFSGSLEDWEKQSKAMQSKLKADVRK